MRRYGLFLGVGAALAVGGKARGATADGVLITNYVSASFSLPGNFMFWVSYCATGTVLVQNPCMQMNKVAMPAMQAVGGTVTYQVYVRNCSLTLTSYNVTVEDVFPENMGYVNPSYLSVAWGGAPTVNPGYYTAAWNAGEPPNGSTRAAVGKLRWVITPSMGPTASVMVEFRMTVL